MVKTCRKEEANAILTVETNEGAEVMYLKKVIDAVKYVHENGLLGKPYKIVRCCAPFADLVTY